MRNAWAGGREHFLSVLGHFDDFTFENVHVSKTLLRLRPVLARRNHIPHVSLPLLLSIPTVPLQLTPGRLTPRLHSTCLANPIESSVTATLPGNPLEWLFVLSLGQQTTSTNGEENGRLAKR